MKVINLEGKKVKEINLPKQFSEDYHPNLIKRAVWTIQSNKSWDEESGRKNSCRF